MYVLSYLFVDVLILFFIQFTIQYKAIKLSKYIFRVFLWGFD